MPPVAGYVPALVAFFLAILFTPAVRETARRIGAVATPKSDRWHRKPTALLGGVAILLSVSATCLLFVPRSQQGMVILGASAFLFAVGLVDDFLHIKPYQKLIGQILGAAIVVSFDITLPWTASPTFNMAITVFWLVGITNALNLLDNMDGLAGGIAAIAAMFLAIHLFHSNQPTEALMLTVFAAALIGFLIYNSHPASIFMGDCGSLFVGFFLAGTALLAVSGGRSRTLLPVLAVPVLILFIPIFDTTLVTLVRKLSGRAASQGGRDHTSHRLVALGMTERSAVWMLYGFATLSGLVALIVRNRELDVSLATIATFTVALTLLGVYLAGVKVYDESEIQKAQQRPLVAFLVDLSYKRRVFEVLLDVILVVLAYYLGHAMLFGPLGSAAGWQYFLQTLPVILAVKMAVFLVAGVYRGLWRYVGLDNVVVYAKAVLISSMASVLVLLFAFRVEGISRSVLVLDGVLLFTFVTASRVAFRIFGKLLPIVRSTAGRRVMIFGAGDAGELLLRELRNNQELQYVTVGFFDDDLRKVGKVIHGLTVYQPRDLRIICEQLRVDEIVISSTKLSEDRIRGLIAQLDGAVALKQMRIQLETIGLGEAPPSTPLDISDPTTDSETMPVQPTVSVQQFGSIQLLERLDSRS